MIRFRHHFPRYSSFRFLKVCFHSIPLRSLVVLSQFFSILLSWQGYGHQAILGTLYTIKNYVGELQLRRVQAAARFIRTAVSWRTFVTLFSSQHGWIWCQFFLSKSIVFPLYNGTFQYEEFGCTNYEAVDKDALCSLYDNYANHDGKLSIVWHVSS